MDAKLTKGKGLEFLQNQEIKNDGVYLVYADSLSCDAVATFEVLQGEVVDYNILLAHSVDIKSKLQKLCNGKEVYTFNVGFFTFAECWKETDMVRKYFYPSAKLIKINLEV